MVSGWLEKKSGGKESGKSKKLRGDHWDKRWFALVGTELSWFKSEQEHADGKAAAGSINCLGSEVFLKEVKGNAFRFTVRTAARELKLRAPSAHEYQLWADALSPLAGQVGEIGRDLSASVDTVRDAASSVCSRDAASSSVASGAGWSGADVASSVASVVPGATVSGWLEKKSGGKEGKEKAKIMEKWDKRYFALVGSELRYWKGEQDALKGKEPVGMLECHEAQVFLKEVKGQVFRFTVRSTERELKLRASTSREYQAWTAALATFTNQEQGLASERVEEHEEEPGEADDLPQVDDPWAGMSSAPPSPAPPAGGGLVGRKASLDQLFDDGAELEEPSSLEDRLSGAVGTEAQRAAEPTSPRDASSAAGSGRDSFLSRIGLGMLAPRKSSGASEVSSARSAAVSNPFGGGDTSARANEAVANPFGPGGEGGVGGGGGGSSSSNPFGAEPVSPGLHPLGTSSAPLANFGTEPTALPTAEEEDVEEEAAYPLTEAAGVLGGMGPPTSESVPFKIIIVGDSGVGKTCLLVRFVEGCYRGNERPTVAVDVSTAALDLGSSTAALSLWDTAGQERFAPLSTPYFRQADGVIIVFDVGRRSSFERVGSYWLEEVFYKACV